MSVIWKGPEREIPGYCLAETDKPLPNNIPENMVESYIEQGLAKRESVKPATNKQKED